MRVGKFRLQEKDVLDRTPAVRAIMKRCVVISAENYEYVAISDLFDDVVDGGLIPEYDLTVSPPAAPVDRNPF